MAENMTIEQRMAALETKIGRLEDSTKEFSGVRHEMAATWKALRKQNTIAQCKATGHRWTFGHAMNDRGVLRIPVECADCECSTTLSFKLGAFTRAARKALAPYLLW